MGSTDSNHPYLELFVWDPICLGLWCLTWFIFRHHQGFAGDRKKKLSNEDSKKRKRKIANRKGNKHGHKKILHLNVPFCFQCTFGGDLICCEGCPASFHNKCLPEENRIKEGECKTDCMGLTPIYVIQRVYHTCKCKYPLFMIYNNILFSGESSWLCPDCIVGKKAFIGDIVWVKFGAYR